MNGLVLFSDRTLIDLPLTLVEAKQHLRTIEDDTSQDTLITGTIDEAREAAEHETRRAFCTQQWKLFLDHFPNGSWCAPVTWAGSKYSYQFPPVDSDAIVLPLPPLQTVDSIKYIDGSGVQQTMDTSEYIVSSGEPTRIVPAYGTWWPSTQWRIEAVEITFTVGYGNSEKVPECAKRWMLARIGALYEVREEVTVDYLKAQPIAFVDRLLDPIRVYYP